jgi:glycosyltransferase involved in cell wall biosynthesis
MSSVNVGYVALAPFIGGSERSLQVILHEASKSELLNPILFCPAESPMNAWAQINNIFTVNVSIDKTQSRLQTLLVKLKIVYFFKKHKIKIAHSNQVWSYPSLSMVPKLTKIKLVCHLRDPISPDIDWWLKVPPSAIICVSNYIYESLNQNYTALNETKEVVTLFNPVNNIEKSNRAEILLLKTAARKKLCIPEEKITFGFIGQISPVKGVLEMLEVLSLCKTINWQIIIAGNDTTPQGDYLSRCKAYTQELGIAENVYFLGFLENTENFYHSIDCILMLSREEPLGRIPLEAGAYSKPTIANAVGGLKEIIEHGKTGILCDIEHLTDIASKIEKSTLDDYEIMGENARDFVERNANPSTYFNYLQQVYGKII